jgi:UDP-N-acetyl-2-amino-2-deoxyglucuronate dehydrogenase
MRSLSVGFVGLSHLHPKSYMPVFAAASGMEVVAVAESDAGVLDSFTKSFPVRGYADWQVMLEREQLDLAVLFLPHYLCPEAGVACAERGVHLLVEKPMAADSRGLRKIVAAAAKNEVVLSSPYVWRYHPVARAMKGYIDDGVLGRIVGCEGRCAAGRLHRYIEGNAGWMLARATSGGGPMYNLGVHWIDLYRWLLTDEVAEVVGKNVKVNEEYDIEDNSFALLTFSRGAVLALDISYTVPDSFPYGRDLYLALRGTAGVLSWSPSFEGVKENLFVCSDSEKFRPATRRTVSFDLEPQPGYAGPSTLPFLRDLAEAIRTGARPPITGEDGLRALEVVEAIYESAEAGRAVQLAGR